jgi:SsrA-binding protein
MPNKENKTLLIENKKAQHLYKFKELFKAGLILFGDEVKSIKTNKVNLDGTYIKLKKEEPYLINLKLPLYKKANINTIKHALNRDIKILLNKKEITKLKSFLDQKTHTAIPIKMFTKNNILKVEFAIASGKKKFDKRDDLKKKDLKRNIDRNFKLNI